MIPTTSKYISRKKSKGYVTVLTLVLFSALSLSLFAMFNSSQIVTHKLKLQNAVDAATYSSVNVVAREMNYMAYTNRAMVANQIAIGQFVGFHSWSRQMQESVGTLDDLASLLIGFVITSPIGGAIKSFTTPMEQYWTQFNNQFKGVLENAVIPAENALLGALSFSQSSVHAATRFILRDTFQTVLKDNNISNNAKDVIDFGAILPTDILYNSTNNFITRTKPVGDGAEMAEYDEFEKIVRGSGDKFVFKRSHDWFNKTIFPLGFYIPKKGGNEFERNSDDEAWEWSAMDTVSVWKKSWGCGWSGCGWDHDEIFRIGWGAAHASEDSNYQYRNGGSGFFGFGGSVHKWDQHNKNRQAINLAISDYADEKVGDESPIRRFHRLDKTAERVITGPKFIAVVRKGEAGVRTRNDVIEDHTGSTVPSDSKLNVEAKGNLLNGSIYAIAKAEVYFSRNFEKTPIPGFERGDKKIEYGNLFSPYWQVRLIDYSKPEITAATSVAF